MDPKTLRTWLILAAIVYLVLPYDLLPDFLGLPGRLDDVLLLAWLAWIYRSHVRRSVAPNGERERPGGPADLSKASGELNAYEVLGISPSASTEEVHAAFRAQMQQYHPDKVAHLGDELQQLAHQKSQQILRAYGQLKG